MGSNIVPTHWRIIQHTNEFIWIINMSDSSTFSALVTNIRVSVRWKRRIPRDCRMTSEWFEWDGRVKEERNIGRIHLDAVENSKNAIDIMANWNVFLWNGVFHRARHSVPPKSSEQQQQQQQRTCHVCVYIAIVPHNYTDMQWICVNMGAQVWVKQETCFNHFYLSLVCSGARAFSLSLTSLFHNLGFLH